MEAIETLTKIFGRQVQESIKLPQKPTPHLRVEINTPTSGPPREYIPHISQYIEDGTPIPRVLMIIDYVDHRYPTRITQTQEANTAHPLNRYKWIKNVYEALGVLKWKSTSLQPIWPDPL